MDSWMYLRKSRALGDPDDPALLDHHRTHLLRLAAENQVVLSTDSVIQEIGSAETVNGRPRFKALLESWERSPRDSGGTLLVTEVERLSRGSMMERGRIAEALLRANIRVLTLSRSYNLRNPDDMLFFSVISQMSEHELGKYKERKALKLDALLRRGRSPNGRPPFGYVWLGKPILEFQTVPERFPILQAWTEEIFSMSIQRIAAKWGVNPWVVHDSLRNPTICGWPARRTAPHHGEKEWAFPAAKLSREDWIWPEQQGEYEPACSRERWEAIQEVLARRRTHREKTTREEDGWARQLVRFLGHEQLSARCDSFTIHPKGDPRRYTYSARPPGAALLYIDRPAVHHAAEEALRTAFRSPEVISEALAAYRYSRAAASQQLQGRNSDVIAAERTKKEKLLVDLFRRELTEESDIQQRAIAQLRIETEKDIQRLTSELQAALAGQQMGPEVDTLIPFLTDHLDHLETYWDKSTRGAQRRVVATAFLHRVLVAVEDTGGRAFRREVVQVEYQPWLDRLMEDHRKAMTSTRDDQCFPMYGTAFAP